jgi:hypothetical protein
VKASRIRTVSETVGLLAVVASLVFVGLEVRQGAEATRAATAQSLNDGWLELNLTMSNPENWRPVGRLFELEDLSEATYEDNAAVHSLMRSLFQHWSNLHWQYLNGQLDQRLWDGVLRNMEGNMRDLRWRRLMIWTWGSQGPIYHDEFQQLFGDILSR